MERGMANSVSTRGYDAAEPRELPEVGRALEDLVQVIARYDNLVHRMIDRLQPVVTPAPPVATVGGSGKDAGYVTPLANSINDMRCKLRDITDDLESLYERIQV